MLSYAHFSGCWNLFEAYIDNKLLEGKKDEWFVCNLILYIIYRGSHRNGNIFLIKCRGQKQVGYYFQIIKNSNPEISTLLQNLSEIKMK